MKFNNDGFIERMVILLAIFSLCIFYFVMNPAAADVASPTTGIEYIEELEQETKATAATNLYVTADYLNIRLLPLLEGGIIDCVPYGTVLSYSSTLDDNWIQIHYNGWTAYVCSKYVTFDKQEANSALYSAIEFRYIGVVYWGGWRWTWYTNNVYNNDLSIPGQYTNENGYICDEDGYVVLASVDLSKGSTVDTPFGLTGKVYDTGCLSGTLDVYTCW